VSRNLLPVLLALVLFTPGAVAADPPKKPAEAVELIGKATDYYDTRNWSSYYWREDFSFVLHDEKSGKDWRIISREPTPAYEWRLGTTYPGLKVDWNTKPRVKVFGITGVDRQPATFYDFKLNEPDLATAFVVWVETKPDEWREFYVNNWFHKWGEKVDPVVYKLYADKQEPYDIYGFINGQVAPFSKKSQTLIDQHKTARMFHGLVRATKDNPFGYEIELVHLFGPDTQGNGKVFVGDAKKMIPLDSTKPQK
jgi:hypothetical protein